MALSLSVYLIFSRVLYVHFIALYVMGRILLSRSVNLFVARIFLALSNFCNLRVLVVYFVCLLRNVVMVKW